LVIKGERGSAEERKKFHASFSPLEKKKKFVAKKGVPVVNERGGKRHPFSRDVLHHGTCLREKSRRMACQKEKRERVRLKRDGSGEEKYTLAIRSSGGR